MRGRESGRGMGNCIANSLALIYEATINDLVSYSGVTTNGSLLMIRIQCSISTVYLSNMATGYKTSDVTRNMEP